MNAGKPPTTLRLRTLPSHRQSFEPQANTPAKVGVAHALMPTIGLPILHLLPRGSGHRAPESGGPGALCDPRRSFTSLLERSAASRTLALTQNVSLGRRPGWGPETSGCSIPSTASSSANPNPQIHRGSSEPRKGLVWPERNSLWRVGRNPLRLPSEFGRQPSFLASARKPCIFG